MKIRVNNGAGRRPESTIEYTMSSWNGGFGESRTAGWSPLRVAAVAAILEQACEDGWRPGLDGLSWRCGSACMGVQWAGGASGQMQAGRSLVLLVRTHASEERTAGGGAYERQLDGAMALAPGIHGLHGLRVVRLWDAVAADGGDVPGFNGVAERLAAMPLVSGAHLRELREQVRLELGAWALPRPPEDARDP